MATKFYLHDATTTDTGTLPGTASVGTTFPAATKAVGADVNRSMDETIGVSQVSSPATTVAAGALLWARRFLSAPLAAQTITVGNWTIAAAALKTGAGSFAFSDATLVLWRPSTGAAVSTIFDAASAATNAGTTETAGSTTYAGAAVTAQDGDILVLETGGDETTGATSVTGCQVFYDGTTEASTTSNAAYLLAPVTITFSSGGGAAAPFRPHAMIPFTKGAGSR